MEERYENWQRGLSIIESYEKRVRAVLALITETTKLVEDNCREVEVVTRRLRENISRQGEDKEAGIKADMAGIFEGLGRSETDINETISEIWHGDDEIVEILKQTLTGNASYVFDLLISEILPRHKERERAIVALLIKFHMDQMILNTTLKSLLYNTEMAS